jgi:phage-related protein
MALGGSAGTAYVELVPKLDPSFNSQLANAVDDATKPAIARMSTAFKDVGAELMATGKKMSLMVTLPLALVGGAAFKLASDLNESMSKVGVVFDDSAGDILEWSRSAARSMGMSRQEALESAGTYGNLFRAMGIGIPTAAKMSKTMVGLAADLGSFNNANPKDVLEALRAGLVGEAEPLRKFGVNLTQARIEAKAMELGLWDGKDAIDAGAKAQAAYALILEDTKLAQGDFARTAGGAANQQRTFVASIKDLGAELGGVLLPIGNKILGFLIDLVDKFKSLSPSMRRIIIVVGLVAAAMGPLIFIIGGIASGIGVLLSPIGLVVLAIAALAVAGYFVYKNWSTIWPEVQRIAGEVWTWIQEHAGWLVDAVMGIVAGVIWVKDNWRQIWAEVQRIASEVWTWLVTNVGPVLTRLWQAFQVAMDRIANVVAIAVAVIKWVWDNFGERIIEGVRIAWDYIKGVIEGVLGIIRGILDIFIGIFTLNWSTFWNGIKEVLGGIWDLLKNTVQTGFDFFLNLFGIAKDLLGIAWGLIWDAIKAALEAAWDGLKAIVKAGLDALVDFVVGVKDKIVDGFKAAWDAAKEATSAAWDELKRLASEGVDKVVDAVKALPGRLLAFVGDMANAGAGLGGALIDAMKSAITGAAGIAQDIGEGLANIVKDAWNAFANTVNDIIPDKIEIPFFPDINLPDNPIPKLHSGGIVPGRIGEEVLILAKAGERVLTREQDQARTTAGTAQAFYGDLYFPNVRDAAGVVRVFRQIAAERT